MKAVLYFNSSDERVVFKTIREIATATIIDREGDLDILAPDILLSNVSESDIFRSNYIYINSFNRYYYINDIQCVRTGVYRLTCTVDVLYTYREYIRAQKGVVGRQEFVYNQYLADGKLKATNKPYIQTLLFPNGFSQNDYTYVLLVGGNNLDISTTPPNN